MLKNLPDAETLSHISLFTGAGGLDIGLGMAGLTTLVCVEKDRHARATLEANRAQFRFPRFELFEDVDKVSGEDLLTAAGLAYGELDLLSGGPPCQSFSTAGHRQSVVDPRGSLFGRFVELIGQTRPRFFLLENVRGILSAAIRHRPLVLRGNGNHPLDPDEELGSLLHNVVLPQIEEGLGYQVTFGLLNAADYGVPQTRQRVIFLGSRDHEFPSGVNGDRPSIAELVPPSHGRDPSGPRPAWLTLNDALLGLNELEPEFVNYSTSRHAVMELVPPGKNWRYLRDTCGDGYLRRVMGGAYSSSGGKVGFWRRLSWELPSPTVPASPIQKGTSLCHPETTRPLSVREYARIQQFPDDYDFAGPTAAKYRQIGNAVPVGLAHAIGSAIAKSVLQRPLPIPV